MATVTNFVGSGFNYLDNRAKTQLDANTNAINTELTSTTGGTLTGVLTTTSTATLSGAGAIPITATIAEWTTTGADAGTLADGAEGQHLFVILVSFTGNGTLTPANFGSGSTVTFTAVGQGAHLVFTNGNWYFVGGDATVA